MEKQIKQLKEFHTAFELPQRDVPTIIPIKEFECRMNLLLEEVEELTWAYEKDDMVEVVDAIVDCLYVLLGTALQFGITNVLEECFDEVHRSNMSKLDTNGKPIVNKSGKVMKGPNYSRPDIARIINNAQKT
jgi:predicted HAD superfamily Cof-like phosphohydrolase